MRILIFVSFILTLTTNIFTVFNSSIQIFVCPERVPLTLNLPFLKLLRKTQHILVIPLNLVILSTAEMKINLHLFAGAPD